MNAKAAIGVTALMVAAGQGHTETVKTLLANGADVNAKAIDGSTALSFAQQKGQSETAQVLKKAGMRTSDIGEDENVKRLRTAVARGRIVDVEALLAKGVDVNAKDKNGSTALMAAGMHAETTKALLDKGANVNMADEKGMTPLMNAVVIGSPGVVRVLLDHGADVNAKSKDGTTALMLAATVRKTDVVKVLLVAGADVNAKTKNGSTALSIAKGGNGSAEIVQILKDAGATE